MTDSYSAEDICVAKIPSRHDLFERMFGGRIPTESEAISFVFEIAHARGCVQINYEKVGQMHMVSSPQSFVSLEEYKTMLRGQPIAAPELGQNACRGEVTFRYLFRNVSIIVDENLHTLQGGTMENHKTFCALGITNDAVVLSDFGQFNWSEK